MISLRPDRAQEVSREVGRRPVRAGLEKVGIGIALAGLTMVLGG